MDCSEFCGPGGGPRSAPTDSSKPCGRGSRPSKATPNRMLRNSSGTDHVVSVFFDACVNIFIYMMKFVLDSEFVQFFSLLCFCSELIDKVQNEMHDLDLFDAVSDMFQGQLVSQVICKKF